MASSLPAVYAQINEAYDNYISCMDAFDEYPNDFVWMLEVVRQQQVWGKLIFLKKEHAFITQRREKLDTFKVGEDSEWSKLIMK